MDSSKIILISVTETELRSLITDAIKQALEIKQEKKLLSFREACDFLGCSSSSLNKWKSENRIPYKRLGKRVFFNRQEIMQALKESGYKKFKELSEFQKVF